MLWTKIQGIITAGIIVETEAYKAPEDKACHAYNNKKTERTSTMFEEGGIAYIYTCYGIHSLFNVVTGPKDVAHAVLIRGIEPIIGLEDMFKRRSKINIKKDLANGPGKLSQALGIHKGLNQQSLYSKNTEVFLTDSTYPVKDITASPRVGIAYAQECSNWPWRFRIKGNKFCSKPHRVKYDWPK